MCNAFLIYIHVYREVDATNPPPQPLLGLYTECYHRPSNPTHPKRQVLWDFLISTIALIMENISMPQAASLHLCNALCHQLVIAATCYDKWLLYHYTSAPYHYIIRYMASAYSDFAVHFSSVFYEHTCVLHFCSVCRFPRTWLWHEEESITSLPKVM